MKIRSAWNLPPHRLLSKRNGVQSAPRSVLAEEVGFATALRAYTPSSAQNSTRRVLLPSLRSSLLFESHKEKTKHLQSKCFCMGAATCRWRKRWDSNPRYISVYLISSQGRYDHFDTLPYSFSQTDHSGGSRIVIISQFFAFCNTFAKNIYTVDLFGVYISRFVLNNLFFLL